MAPLEVVLFWLTMAVYALGSGGYIYSFAFRNERVLNRMRIPVTAGFVLHTLTIAARYQAQGHLPWAGDYENGLSGGWFIILFTLFVLWKKDPLPAIGTGTLPLSLLIMGYGVMRNPVLEPMAASLKSTWLAIHVFFAWFAYSAYMLACAAGVLMVLKSRDSQRDQRNPVYEKIPSLERLDELIFRYIVFGFIMDAVMLASGSIWANDLWGTYWNWDPVETWSLVSWLMYGVIIHLRVTLGWRGLRLAWLAIGAILGVLISFFGVTFIVESSLHIFNVR